MTGRSAAFGGSAQSQIRQGWTTICAQHEQDFAISLSAKGAGSIVITRKRLRDYCSWLHVALLGKNWRKLKSTQRLKGLVFIENAAVTTTVRGVLKLPSKAKLSRPFVELSADAWKAAHKNGTHLALAAYDKVNWGTQCTNCMQNPTFRDSQIIFLQDLC